MPTVASCIGPEGFGNYVVDWSGAEPVFERVHRPADVLLVPGFVDIHIHGGFGIDFMSASSADLLHLCKRLEAEGYEAFLPTTVTAPAESIRAALARLPEHPMIAGFHLEGPYISPEFPGAQPPEFIAPAPPIPSDWDDILDDPRLRVITLAPEIPHALAVIAKLSQRGVVVSMGHSNATFDEARFGFEFGARHTTHTFNAMRPFHHREAGIVGYALSQPAVNCELIYDRLHVVKDAAGFLLKAKSASGVIAVSDSTMATGMVSGTEINMWNHPCLVGKKSVRLASNGALAGSAITLLDAFQNLASDFGEEIAIRTCSLNARKALGMTGRPRVYLEFDKHLDIAGRRTIGQPAESGRD